MLLLVWLSIYDVVGEKRQQFLSGGNQFYQGLNQDIPVIIELNSKFLAPL